MSCHMAASAIYVWYRNGVPYKQGNKLCCVAVSESGVYTVEVQYGEERDVSEPVCMICDMGLGKLKSAQSLSHTQSTSVLGTPAYMAPECLVGKKKAAIQSDVWSLSCTLVELFMEKDCWEELLESKKSFRGSRG